MLSEISQIQKGKYRVAHLDEAHGIGKFMQTESRVEVTRGWGLLPNEYKFLLGKMKKIWKRMM